MTALRLRREEQSGANNALVPGRDSVPYRLHSGHGFAAYEGFHDHVRSRQNTRGAQ